MTTFSFALGCREFFISRNLRTTALRDFLTVCLIIDKPNLFPDNWIYVHGQIVEQDRFKISKTEVWIWSPTKPIEVTLVRIFPRLNRPIFRVSLGIVVGVTIAALTWLVLLRRVDSSKLEILGGYLPGYTVSPYGSIIGLAYGFSYGFFIGWFYALLKIAA